MSDSDRLPEGLQGQDDHPIDESHIRTCLKDAEELKIEGNDQFRGKQWEESLALYRTALGRLPRRKADRGDASSAQDKGKGRADDLPEGNRGESSFSPSSARDDSSASASEVKEAKEAEEEHPDPTELEVECARVRSVLNANIGACYVKLGDHKEAVAACTQALLDDPGYAKALQRRAASNEQLDTWSSLSSAQEDYTTLLTLLPPSSPQASDTKRSLATLKPRVEAAQKRETDEMLGKLKGMGNNILGKFGLSTDNFQFVPNGQGGYSMNFVQ